MTVTAEYKADLIAQLGSSIDFLEHELSKAISRSPNYHKLTKELADANEELRKANALVTA